MLVFTDLQYWSSSARASSFANRIMSAALSEGQCLFIGVSMKDTNLLRWLALRSLDREHDQIDFGQERIARWIAQRDSNDPEELHSLLDTVLGFLKDPSTSESQALDKNSAAISGSGPRKPIPASSSPISFCNAAESSP